MPVDAILGLQWGDEGKGKIVDFLADKYHAVCRFQGGPNAGHTLWIEGRKFVLHTLPSGIFRKNTLNLIGNGVVIDPITLAREIQMVSEDVPDLHQRLFVSQKAHLILPTHRWIDQASELAKGKNKIGSTLRGIGPCYMDKTGRNGLRIGDLNLFNFKQDYFSLKEKHLQFLKLFPTTDFNIEAEEKKWFEAIETIKELQIINGEYWLNNLLDKNTAVLAEGAQGTMLDVDFGTYPFVTSSNTIAAGICTGLGVPPNKIRKVIGIAKAYCTRVGSGPFPSELTDAVGEKLRIEGNEFGSTTGRPRRCGWLDLVQLKYSTMINGVTDLCITKVDVLNSFDEIKLVQTYTLDNLITTNELPFHLDEIKEVSAISLPGWNQSLANCKTKDALPTAVQHLLNTINEHSGIPVKLLSTGPGRDELLQL
ncbi:MAG: adenylosuccinate synthase [Saprospiraceae bacterium]|nr:adenylosuccinate synthase [Saprospiraceae bacterium]MBK8450115.1 adenylosuccinate synthase [Saprospiraceae bacterium]MBK8483789.1 adenylosuccinate synthase [Saprospiraceae bacterium]MBK9221239.1 adenylosuccinate synthase [Saprospiraceae bacterium]MBK9728887.1 adenylosuccinate synthase [Saprospiraceae bacterium]